MNPLKKIDRGGLFKKMLSAHVGDHAKLEWLAYHCGSLHTRCDNMKKEASALKARCTRLEKRLAKLEGKAK